MPEEKQNQRAILTQNAAGEVTQYSAEQINIIKVTKGSYDTGQEGFFVGFCEAMAEIAGNRSLMSMDKSLLFLLFSLMNDPKVKQGPNTQTLLSGPQYAVMMGYKASNKSSVSNSFDRLEKCGYVLRDKKTRSVAVIINPAVATNTSTKDYAKIWNQTALNFGNEMKKEKQPSLEGKQDFNSDLPRQLADKLKS